jgi:DNA-binding NarL/FixJ family response regulator
MKKIIILDDEPLISALVKELLEEDKDLEVNQTVDNQKDFLELVENQAFDAALIDISVGGREGGMEILKVLKMKRIALPCLMLSAHDERGYALRCLQAGAQGFISKSNVCLDLIRGLKEVLKGNCFVSGDKGESIVQQYRMSNLSV